MSLSVHTSNHRVLNTIFLYHQTNKGKIVLQIIFAATLCLAKASYYPIAPAHVQLSPDGKFLLDTPEVAHAKAAHLAAHAQASTGHAAWAPAGGAYLGGHGGYAAGAHYGAPAAGMYSTNIMNSFC